MTGCSGAGGDRVPHFDKIEQIMEVFKPKRVVFVHDGHHEDELAPDENAELRR